MPCTDPRYLGATQDDILRDMLRVMLAAGEARRDADRTAALVERAARRLDDVVEADRHTMQEGRAGAFEHLRKQLGLDEEAEPGPKGIGRIVMGGRVVNRRPVRATMDDDEVPG